MNKLLVANRGEIAVRVMRACREMGLATVAVYSEADRNAPHVALADEAHLIGPGPAGESYLCGEKIIAKAKQAGADAIHPGYGFLSENAAFAEACEQAGLTFVGPPASAIRALGDKIGAKRLMESAGVPVVPGYNGDDQSAKRLKSEATRIGYPLLIKATAGGGGRGMRIVSAAEDFAGALEEARREAEAAFGDDRVLLERFVERARHIEFQIFGDVHGNVIHLFERECSIQRRHQKIIEESPSPILTPQMRARMAEAAVKAGAAAGYVNAGTVEFLFEERPNGEHQFYFLEVNTRLQVEHPVTESVTGIDIVKLQLRIAAGEPLPYAQEQIVQRGHAIETRIYAEDPSQGFMPSIGRLSQWIEPEGPWIRVDSGVEQGSEVSPFYDPMLAKLIVWGETRAEALARMKQALLRFHVLGVQTNIPHLLDIIRHPEFVAGRTKTGFLAEHFRDWKPSRTLPNEALLALAAETVTRPDRARGDSSEDGAVPFDPWREAGHWRNVKTHPRPTTSA